MAVSHTQDTDEGFSELEKQLQDMMKAVDASKVHDALEAGAKAFTKDLLKLPYPISRVRKPGYTHLVDSFSYEDDRKHKGQLVVGWGKYYGPMVEKGTKLQKKQPHLESTYDKHRTEYERAMMDALDIYK